MAENLIKGAKTEREREKSRAAESWFGSGGSTVAAAVWRL